MLHFSFHDIAGSLSSRAKSVGSFHLRFDYINMKVFRPFIIHPVKTGYQFYKFADFSRHLLNYYTTDQILPNFNEFTAYMTRNPDRNEPSLVSKIIVPIYDMMINQLLHPMAQLKLPTGTVIPIPIRDRRNGVTKSCTDMYANPGPRPRWFGGKTTKNRTRSRLSRKKRRRTVKRFLWWI